MSNVSPYLMTYFIMLAIYRLLEMTAMKGNKSRLIGSKSKDPTYYLIVIPFMLAIIEPPLEYALTDHQPNPLCFFGGMGLFIITTIFRIKSLIDIKGGFSPNIEKSDNQVLVTKGTYSLVRHPLYLTVLLLAIAVAIMLAAVWAWIFILAAAVGVLTRIPAEEKFLLKQFPEYQSYCEKTWRLIPGIY